MCTMHQVCTGLYIHIYIYICIKYTLTDHKIDTIYVIIIPKKSEDQTG